MEAVRPIVTPVVKDCLYIKPAFLSLPRYEKCSYVGHMHVWSKM